ncbi:hypothetical protein ACQKWADRAFT_323786 [Trichoderma austrokoningii]
MENHHWLLKIEDQCGKHEKYRSERSLGIDQVMRFRGLAKWLFYKASFRQKNFTFPRLRHSVFDADTIIFEAKLGGGLDGHVWKVWFGEQGPFALKMFWAQAPPQAFGHYYALQRECQNNAIIHMMQASMASYPVELLKLPEGEEAGENYSSFAQENSNHRRESGVTEADIPADHKFISSAPRMAKCHGWLKLQSHIWDKLPRDLKAPRLVIEKTERYMQRDVDYVCLVYELIEAGDSIPSVVEEVSDFLYHAGFSFTLTPLARNWVNSVLVDYSDIIHYGEYGWRAWGFKKRTADQLLQR